jgi:hypothetical protein
MTATSKPFRQLTARDLMSRDVLLIPAMQRTFWVAAMLALSFLLGVATVISPAEEPKKDKDKGKDATQALMQRKLKEAQKALEGIALNNFDKISSSADELIEISKVAEWKVLKDPQYEMFSNEFRRRADQMRKAARDKNLDRATLSYVEITMTCVRCHEHVRDQRRGQADPIDSGSAVGQ